MNTPAHRLLLGLITLLGILLLAEWLVPENTGTLHGPSGLRLLRGNPKTPLVTRAVEEWEGAILARPLFTMSRRPAKVATGPAAAVDDARLSGIMIGAFGRRAIFAPPGGGKPLVLGEGAAVNDSTIRSIGPDQVVLANGAVLRPSFDKNRVVTSYTPPFQPPVPVLQGQPPGTPPAPGFPLPRFVQPPFQQPQTPPPGPAAGDNDSSGAPPQPAAGPVFRAPFNPNRRDQ